MPLVRYSIIPSLHKWYISSCVSFASFGKTCLESHSCSGRSSAKERKNVIAVCVWAFLNPGINRLPLTSICLSHTISFFAIPPKIRAASSPSPINKIRFPSTHNSPCIITNFGDTNARPQLSPPPFNSCSCNNKTLAL